MTARQERAVVTLPFPVHRPDHWTEDAACARPDVEAEWFDAPHDGETRSDGKARIARAKAVCQGCPVAAECRDAIVPGDEGVRAGKLVGQRDYGETTNPDTPIKQHGTPSGARAHYRRGDKPCEACRLAENAKALEYKAARKQRAS